MTTRLDEDFSIGDVLTENLIEMDLKAHSKEEAIRELVDLLYYEGIIGDTKDFADDVFKREDEGMTGLGQGIAIPHGKSDSVIKTSLVVGKAKYPIEWESLDEQPVEVIILFAVKNTEANTTHIKLLQKVARLLADEDFITSLTKATSKKSVMKLLSKDVED